MHKIMHLLLEPLDSMAHDTELKIGLIVIFLVGAHELTRDFRVKLEFFNPTNERILIRIEFVLESYQLLSLLQGDTLAEFFEFSDVFSKLGVTFLKQLFLVIVTLHPVIVNCQDLFVISSLFLNGFHLPVNVFLDFGLLVSDIFDDISHHDVGIQFPIDSLDPADKVTIVIHESGNIRDCLFMLGNDRFQDLQQDGSNIVFNFKGIYFGEVTANVGGVFIIILLVNLSLQLPRNIDVSFLHHQPYFWSFAYL